MVGGTGIQFVHHGSYDKVVVFLQTIRNNDDIPPGGLAVSRPLVSPCSRHRFFACYPHRRCRCNGQQVGACHHGTHTEVSSIPQLGGKQRLLG